MTHAGRIRRRHVEDGRGRACRRHIAFAGHLDIDRLTRADRGRAAGVQTRVGQARGHDRSIQTRGRGIGSRQREPAFHVNDDVGVAIAVVDADRATSTERDLDEVGHGRPLGEIQIRGRRARHAARIDGEPARRIGPGHRHVDHDGRGAGRWNADVARHRQREGLPGAELAESVARVEDAMRAHGVVLPRPGRSEFQGQLAPQIDRVAVVAERPHAGPHQVVVVDEVVLIAERRRVVVIELAPAVVVPGAWVAGRRTPPRGPGRLRRGVPAPGQLLRAGEVVENVRVHVRRRATSGFDGAVERGGVGRVLVPVVSHAEHHLGGRRLGQILRDGEGVVVGKAVERGVRARLPRRHVAGRHVVRHHEHAINDRSQVADLEEAAVPAGRAAVGVDRHPRRRPALMHLPRELGHEVGEAGLNIRIAVRGPFEIDVDAVEVLRRDQVDGVRDHGLDGRRVGHDRVENRGGRADGAVRFDDEHHAITRRVRVGDDGGEILAVPAGPADVVRGDAAVGIEVDAEIGHGGEQRVIPVRVLRQAPVGRESEDLTGDATRRGQCVRT